MPASWTDPDVVTKAVELMKDIGQAPIVVKKEVNGFVLNRLQYAIIMEAWRLVEVRRYICYVIVVFFITIIVIHL